MSAPPGFNAGATVLPDNPSAQIHVMRGGGGGGGGGSTQTGGFNMQELEKLTEYGLEQGGIIADEIDEPTKIAFLKQESSGICAKNSGDSVIMKKDCWAVVEVTRALINYHIRTSNLFKNQFPPKPPKSPKSLFPRSTSPNSGEVPNPFLHSKKTALENLKEKAGLSDNNNDDNNNDDNNPSNDKKNNNPSNIQNSVSKLDARLKIETNISKNDFYSNIELKGKPTRFRGKIPKNITNKYKGKISGGKRQSVYSNKTRKNI